MNREDIIRMAREAGLYNMKAGGDFACFEWFARLIAEDCAKRCEEEAAFYGRGRRPDRSLGANACAVAIREAYKP